MSCGDGAKGERRYDWALVASTRPEISLLIRRSVSRPPELAFYLCHTPRPAPLSRLVRVAGTRWAVEMGHRWYPSSCAVFSRSCSSVIAGFLLGWVPSGLDVVAGRACPALA